MTLMIELCQKKRRNLKKNGYMKDLKGDLNNVELEVSRNEEMCSRNSEKVSLDIP